MGSLIVQPIIEYLPYLESNSIKKSGCMYYLYAAEDKWIFPWRRTIRLNISKIYIPDNHLVFTESFDPDYYDIESRFSDTVMTSVKVKLKGLIPFKVCIGTPLVKMMLFKPTECHLINLK